MNRFFILITIAFIGIFTIVSCKTDSKKVQVDFKRTENTLSIRLRAEADRLNPVLTTSNYARQVVDQIFQYLLTIDPQTYEFIPQLAKARPTVQDITDGPWKGGVAYTYEIFEEAQWDNGTPITAQDFIFTLKAVFNPLVQAQAFRAYLAFIKDVQVDPSNPKKFTVITNEKYILGEESISNGFAIMPASIYDPQGLMNEISLAELADPAKAEALAKSNENLKQFAEAFNSEKYAREKGFVSGSGPYQFEEWQSGQKIVLTKKANWWGNKLSSKYPGLEAFPDKLEFLPITDPAAVLAAVKAEEIDVVTELDTKDFLDLRSLPFVQERYNFHTPPALAYNCIYINNKNPKLADKRVRRALAHAIDIEEIIKTVYDGFGERTALPLLPSSKDYDKNLKLVDYNVAKAKDLLQQAGWKDTNNNGIVDKEINGERVELTLGCQVSATSESGRNAILLMQGTAKQAGIGIEIIPKEFRVIMEDVRADNHELAVGGRTIPPITWDPKQDWHSEGLAGGSNHANFENAAADKLIEEIQVTLDDAKRAELYKRFQAILYDEQPFIFLFIPTNRILTHKRFEAQATSILPGFVPNQIKLNL